MSAVRLPRITPPDNRGLLSSGNKVQLQTILQGDGELVEREEDRLVNCHGRDAVLYSNLGHG